MDTRYGAGTVLSVQRPDATGVEVRYDANDRSYAVLANDDALATLQTQGSSQIGSNPIADVFRGVVGLVTNTLQLTRTGSGSRFGTRFVAGGLLQRNELVGGVDQTQATSFVFGLRTPDAEMPRTGSANFGVGLLGSYAGSPGLQPLTGGGVLSLDFASGRLTGSGTGTARWAVGSTAPSVFLPNYFNWAVDSQLAATGNRLQGTINLEFTRDQRLTGPVDGRLFGPGGSEIGASFSAGLGQQGAVGTITGVRGNTPPAEETLSALLTDISTQYLDAEIIYTGTATANVFARARNGSIGQSEVRLFPDTQTIDLPFNRLEPAARLDSASDERFLGYRTFAQAGRIIRTTQLYRSGSDNPEVQLDYSTFALTELVDIDFDRRVDTSTIFGLQTGFATAPRSGRGIYNGVLYGSALGGDALADRFSLRGTATIELDWSASLLAGRLNPVATNQRTGISTALGELTLSNAGPRIFETRFGGVINGPPGTLGRISGALYGPTGEEALGVFQLVMPGAGTQLAAQGVVATRRQSIAPSSGTPAPLPATPSFDPPPTPLNAALDQLSVSESFLTRSARTSAVYPFEGTSPLFLEDGQLTVSFDAATGNYTVSVPGSPPLPAMSAAFTPASRDAALSDAVANVYRTGTAANGDLLRLGVPGSAGLFGTRFVAGGIWQRTSTNSGIELNRIEAFTWGYRTPTTAVPRVGPVSWTVGLDLLRPTRDGMRQVLGSGQLAIDWNAGGAISGRGSAIARGPLDNGAPEIQLVGFAFSGNAAVGANLMSGNFQSREVGGGGFAGFFYGPGATEIGLSLGLGAGGEAPTQLAGYVVGVQGGTPAPIENLTSLRGPVSVERQGRGINYRLDAAPHGGFDMATPLGDFDGRVRLFPDSGTLDFAGASLPQGAAAVVGPADQVAAESDARFTTYRVTGPTGTTTWRRYASGSGNDQLALSYASFALMQYQAADGFNADRSLLFGLATPPENMPRTGTGAYQGFVYGSAVGVGPSGPDRFTLGGMAQVDVNWASTEVTGTLAVDATNTRTSVMLPLLAITLDSARVFSNQVNGFLAGGATGTFSGQFFGPDAGELGATLDLRTVAGGGLPALVGQGLLVGKRQ